MKILSRIAFMIAALLYSVPILIGMFLVMVTMFIAVPVYWIFTGKDIFDRYFERGIDIVMFPFGWFTKNVLKIG